MLDIVINVYKQDSNLFEEIKEILINNKLNLQTIMANLADLQAKVVELQASVDAEQEQIKALLDQNAATILSLTEQIAALQALVDAAPTPEQIQSVIDALQATKEDIEGTVA